MKLRWIQRRLALLLCLCLLPAAALAQGAGEDDSAVTRADFSLGFQLHADAFPFDGKTDYQGWEAFLQKLSLRGVMDTQRFLTSLSRVYYEGDLYLNGEPIIPLTYEGYWSFRYIRSPALQQRSIHFQMHNFLEFMLKPYYYMDLPTQYLGVLLYPEATAYMLEAYGQPIRALMEKSGSGSRTISYVELYELCEELDAVAADDDKERVYFYLTSLLAAFQASDAAYDAMCYLEDYLDFLDPEQEGMTIAVSGDTETYTIGRTDVLVKTEKDGATELALTLPNQEGFLLTLTYRYAPKAQNARAEARLAITAGEDTRLALSLTADGLLREGEKDAMGTLTLEIDGSALPEPVKPWAFDFRLTRTAPEPPYAVSLGVDWLHPDTGKPAVTMLYRADIEMHGESLLKDHIYDNQNDFFHLNEDYLEEYRRDFALPLALALAPVLLEMPSGAINDVVRFLGDSGILTSLGFE